MPNIQGQLQPILSDFSYGELSPRMLGRSETAVYHKGAQTMQNFVPMIQGGFRKRTGTLQIGTVLNNNPYVRLRGMVVSGSLWYLLEFSAASSGASATLRVWGNLSTTPSVIQTISTPYLGSELAAMQFGWAYPNLFISHANHPPAMITYVAGPTFTLVQPIPLVGSAATYFLGVSLTMSVANFALPSAYPIASLSANIVQAITILSYVYSAPNTTLTVSNNPLNSFWSYVGKLIYINGSTYTVVAVTGSTIVVSGNVAYTGVSYMANTGLPITAIYGGIQVLSTYLSYITPTTVYMNAGPAATPGGTVTLAVSQDIISPTTPNLPFQGTGNYPSAVACANQRVLWMSSNNMPQDVWASVVGIWDAYGNMEMQFFELTTYNVQQLSLNSAGQPLDAQGNIITAAAQNTPAYINVPQTQEIVGDADGFNGSIFSDQNDSIQWAVSAADIIIGTLSGQVMVQGGATANTYAFQNVSRTGCAPIQGYFMTGGVLFIDRAGKRVLLLNWQGINIATPPPQTLSNFSEHLFEQNAITQIAYAASPVMRLWFLRTDGTLVCCDYDDQYDVKAWWQLQTTGTILSLAVGPNTAEDDLYVATSYNGKVILEMLSSPYWNPASYSGSGGAQPPIFLDHAVQYYNATPFTALTAGNVPLLANLNGQTVSCWGDGAYLGTAIVSAGAVTLPMPAGITSVHYAIVGMPYTCTMTTMPFDLGSLQDSTRADKQHTPRVSVTLINSLDGTISGKPGGQAQNAVPATSQVANPTLFTGTKRVAVSSGIGLDATITISSALPLPCTVTALVPMVGDRERG
jgi:hypothetical protein